MRVSIDGIPYKSLREAVETVFGTFIRRGVWRKYE